MQLKYFWPPVDDNAVCLNQDYTLASATTIMLNINGDKAIPLPEGNIANFSAAGYSRNLRITIQITSGSLLGVVMIISGTQNNNAASVVVGPDNWGSYTGTVTINTIVSFSTVNSIIVTNTNPAPEEGEPDEHIVIFKIRIGTGLIGFFNVINIVDNINAASHVYNLSFATDGCRYTIYEAVSGILDGTCDELISSNVFMKPDSISDTNNPSTIDQLFIQLTDVCSYLLVKVETVTISEHVYGTLNFNFLLLE